MVKENNDSESIKQLESLSKKVSLFNQKKDLAVVSCYFNPCRYKSRLKNYKIFREGIIRTGVKFLTVELAFGEDDFELSDFPEVMQLRTNKENIMWQKERLLNIGIQKLIKEGYKKIAWLDADIVFEDDNWVRDLSEKLNKYPVCQVFGEVNFEGWSKKPLPGFVKYYSEKKEFNLDKSRPGGGWAAKSDILSKINLYDASILGGGDSLFSLGCYFWEGNISEIKKNSFLTNEFNFKFLQDYFKWAEKTGSLVRGNVGYINQKIKALFHGNEENRRYVRRNQIYKNFEFDPNNDITIGKDGCFEWINNKKEMQEKIREYFYLRREDDKKPDLDNLKDNEDSSIRSKLDSLKIRLTNLRNLHTNNVDNLSVREEETIIPKFPKKLPGSFWGITSFFNPVKYKNKIENYRKFRESGKKQGLKLLCVELAFGNEKFELKKGDADILIQLRGGDVLWQKERLLNIGLENLPEDCDKIVWLDCDIIFENDDWIEETSRLLEEYKIIQPYSFVVRLPRDGYIRNPHTLPLGTYENQRIHSIAYGVVHRGFDVLNLKFSDYGHTGFAWSARKEIFDKCGFYDKNILFFNDKIIAYSFYSNSNYYERKNCPKSMLDDLDGWIEKIGNLIKKSVYYTNGYVFHLWHGYHKNRFYGEMSRILEEYKFNPNKDIKLNNSGLWEWASYKPKLHRKIKDYFYERREEE